MVPKRKWWRWHISLPLLRHVSDRSRGAGVKSGRQRDSQRMVPVLHLLMLFEPGEMKLLQVVIAAAQTGVLFFVTSSRLSGLWMVVGLGLSIVARVAVSMLSNDRHTARIIAVS
jgi:hypothetical protein